MKIGEIIQKRKTELGLTQQEIADKLGVTPAAVSKWVKDLSFPDVMLLPPLARLLQIDVNTLLSFEEELTRDEISTFINRLAQEGTEKGAEHAFEEAVALIHQYPNCHLLLLNAAIIVDGLGAMRGNGQYEPDYSNEIEEWYRRAAQSEDVQIKNQASAQLVTRYMKNKDYEKAQELLDSIPAEPSFDRRHLQAVLLTRQGKWEEAAKLTEAGLLQDSARAQTALSMLMDVALHEENMEAAEQLVQVSRRLADALDSHPLTSLGLRIQQAESSKDAEGFLSAMREMLELLLDPWPVKGTILFRHLPNKEMDPRFGATMRAKLIEDMEEPKDRDLDFVRERPEFAALLDEYKASVKKEEGP